VGCSIEPHVERRGRRRGVGGRLDKINTDIVTSAREVKSEAERSIENFEWDLTWDSGEPKAYVEGRIDDIREFEHELEDIVRGYGVRTKLKTDLNVDARAGLTIELVQPESEE
jgi:hypothetical protein